MEKRAFRKLMSDLERRVHEEGKKNPSWLMGYLQGLGIRCLTGFQCAALIDLLLVPLEENMQPVSMSIQEKKESGIPEDAGTSNPEQPKAETLASRIQLKRP